MNSQYSIRLAEPSDAPILFRWANDPAVRTNALGQKEITWDEHIKWFSGKMENGGSVILILAENGVPVGQVRFDRLDSLFLIDYSIDSDYRGKGLGRKIIQMGIESAKHRLSGAIKLRAEVLESNAGSLRVFDTEGFSRIGEKSVDERLFIIFERIV